MTNEFFRYRVISVATSDAGYMVEFENCFLLDVARVPIDDFKARRLRALTPLGVND